MATAKTPEEEPNADTPEGRMTFTAHLGELRIRLIRSAIAVMVGFGICYAFSNQIIDALKRPLSQYEVKEAAAPTPPPAEPTASPVAEPQAVDAAAAEAEASDALPAQLTGDAPEPSKGGIEWITLTPLEGILVKLKISAYGGLFFAFPYVLYQLCAFIFPGLTQKERRAALMLVAGCSGLGITGASVAYWQIFPKVLPYMMKFVPDDITTMLRLSETLPFIIKGILAFGIAFQFPVVVLLLVYIGILTPASLKEYRRVAIIAIFVAGAMLTPPDPVSLILIALPLVVLYEVSIWLSYFVIRKKQDTQES